MKHVLSIIIFLGSLSLTSAQQQYGQIKGIVVDSETLEPLPFVKIVLFDSTHGQVGYASTDFDGKYILNSINPGTYNLEIRFISYTTIIDENIIIKLERITIKDYKLSAASENLDAVQVISYSVPLINHSGTTITRNDLSSVPRKSSTVIASTVGGVYKSGSRSNNINSYEGSSTEEYAKINDNSFKKVNKYPLSTFSIDVDNASYSNVRRFINEGNKPPKDAVRVEELINYFSYDYEAPLSDELFSIDMEYTDCPWNKKNKIARIAIKGKEIDLNTAKANNLVFLIDVSGSMGSANKLELLKSGFNLLVNELRSKDKISIVVYAGAAGVVLPMTKGNHKSVIKNAITKLNAGGSTAGGQGIELAYKIAKDNFIKNGNNRIILATDGDFNVGISGAGELERFIESKRNDNIFLSVLGFGSGNYKDAKMEILADKGNGNYYYIDNIMEAKKVLVKELGGTLYTIAKDVKIQAEFNPKHVKSYRLIGYVNRALNDEDFEDDTKDAGELGAGHCVTALYEIVPAKNDKTEASTLKYQNGLTAIESPSTTNELLTIKFRYKTPKGKKSKLITKVLSSTPTLLENASIDTRFALSVSGFGMLLRHSEYKGNLNYKAVLKMAQDSKGEDKEGYRAEFIELIKKMMKRD